MIWQSWSEFLDMGGYDLYVWGSVIVAVGGIAAELVLLRLRRGTIMKHLGVSMIKERARTKPRSKPAVE